MNYNWNMMASLFAQRTAWFGVFLCLGVSGLQAQGVRIGNAPVVRNEVEGTLVSGVVPIQIGDSVFRDEGMRTGADSEARVVFLDDTNVSLGPNSNLKLDKFVYADQGAQAVTVNVTKGLLRFVTGKGDKNAYKINTPVATIGVRGTVFDVVADDGNTSVTLLEGELRVCQQNARECTTLNRPNQQANVTSGGITRGSGPSPFQAATGCAGGLCDTSTYVANLLQKSPLYSSPLPAPPNVLPPVPPNAIGQNNVAPPPSNNDINNPVALALLVDLTHGSTAFSTSPFTGGGLTVGQQCSASPTFPGVGACNLGSVP
jgi:hypothetical protein